MPMTDRISAVTMTTSAFLCGCQIDCIMDPPACPVLVLNSKTKKITKKQTLCEHSPRQE